MTTWEGHPLHFLRKCGEFCEHIGKCKKHYSQMCACHCRHFYGCPIDKRFMQVVFRYVLRRPLSWSEELARYTFVWISLLGAAAVIPKSLTQGIDLLVKRIAGIANGCQCYNQAIDGCLCAILAFKGMS